MTAEALRARVREVCCESLPLPGGGETAKRHVRLMELGRENLSLARLAEAHFDAVAILTAAGRVPQQGVVYGVWAAEKPGEVVHLDTAAMTISGTKQFCSGAGIVDRALVTVDPPDPLLVDLDLSQGGVRVDLSEWHTPAFVHTNTAVVTFEGVAISEGAVLCERGWYLRRPGFWHGALGPASCWAGGALGVVDFARGQSRKDPHTLAHLGAMDAAAWELEALLRVSGEEADAAPMDAAAAHLRALRVRHLVERTSTEILERLGRAYGPYPLAFVEEMATRCQELTVYLRQCHAERDLAALGEALLTHPT